MKYFIYSRTQQKELATVATKVNKKYTPGKVNNKGVTKPYTEILSTEKSRYSDAVTVVSTSDDTLNSINYTDATYL